MKCQILFSGKNKKNVVSLSSAELAQRVAKVKTWGLFLKKGVTLKIFLSESRRPRPLIFDT